MRIKFILKNIIAFSQVLFQTIGGSYIFFRMSYCFFISFIIIILGFNSILFSQTANPSPAEKEAIDWLKKAAAYTIANPDSAQVFAQNALLIGEKEDLKIIQIQAYASLGEIAQRKPDIEMAISLYIKAIAIGEANKLEHRLGPAYNGLGLCYYYAKDIKKSDFYLKKAANAKLKLGDAQYYAVIMSNLAGIYHAQGKHEDALNILKSIEPNLIQYKEYEALTALYNSIGSIQQVSFQNIDSAEYYYTKSMECGEKHQLASGLISPYHNLGQIKMQKGDYATAINYLERALEISKKLKNYAMMVMVYSSLSEVYDATADYKKAYFYKNKQQVLSDSIFKQEQQKTIQELEIKYQSAKKEEQILQKNKEIQSQQLQYERTRFLLLLVLFLLLIALFIAFYFWQRKQANQRLEKEKAKIFHNIVHEIRTPLTLIKGPLEQLKKEYQIPEKEQNWQLVAENSDKLMRMVNELLDASKLEKGKYQLVYQFGDIQLFIHQIIKNFESEAQRKNIALEFNSDDIPPFSFAANALEIILNNLVVNALKYCPNHSRIQIITKLVEDNLFSLEVADNGPGIPEKDQKRIFERFYQVENQNNTSGTGIGLSMVKDLADLMQGKLELKTQVGQGTSIKIVVPVHIEPITEQEFIIIENSIFPTLLIVEDDAQILSFASQVLQKDFNIITASNGQLGIEKALETLPNLILTDIMMPQKDGIALLEELKNNPLSSHIPILVFSAKSSLESRLQGLNKGADAYLPKPFHPEELLLTTKNLWKTVQKNQKEYQESIVKSDKPCEERVKGQNEFLDKIVDCILAHLSEPEYSVNELSNDLFMSRSQLHRKLDALTGMSTTHFIKMVRLEKAKDMLRNQSGNITEIAYSCGFSSLSYFTKSFKEHFGEPPSSFSSKS